MTYRDFVLSGATAEDVTALSTVLNGGQAPNENVIKLQAKGWLHPDIASPVITLEGRALLDVWATKTMLRDELR